MGTNIFGSNIAIPPTLLIILLAWSLLWKGIALWRAAANKQRNWFIIILVIDTIGILELIYLFRYCKNPLTIDEIREWFKKLKS